MAQLYLIYNGDITTVHGEMEMQKSGTVAPLLHVGAFSTNHRAMDCMGTGETGEDLLLHFGAFSTNHRAMDCMGSR